MHRLVCRLSIPAAAKPSSMRGSSMFESDVRLPKLMLLPYLPAEGRVAAAIDAVIARRNGRSAYYAPHARALLAPCGERASYLERAIDRKKRKELRRQRNRLADRGSVSTHVASSPSAVASALDDFFALEAEGWKGRAGTAARSDRHVAQFVQTAVTALAAEGKAQVARLCLEEEAIAGLVTLAQRRKRLVLEDRL